MLHQSSFMKILIFHTTYFVDPKMIAPESIPNTRQSTYRLTYFTLAGRAEVMRQLFACAGQVYEDRRLEWEQWRGVKTSK